MFRETSAAPAGRTRNRATGKARPLPARGRLRLALLTILALALGWQSYLTGTHVHPNARLFPFAAAGEQLAGQAPVSPAHQRNRPALPDNCPICQEIQIAAHYLPPATIMLPQPVAIADWYLAASPWQLPVHRQSHGWRSRAPPLPTL